MDISTEILAKTFADFANFIEAKDGKPFTSFAASKYFYKEEKYKEAIYKEARATINNGRWKPEDVGSGKVHRTITDAIKDKAIHNFQSVDNNLINNWRLKDDFSKFKPTKELEQLLFNLYKSIEDKDEEVFNGLINQKHPYNLVAYLFFIKDSNQFVPISQQRFDKIFELIQVKGFKTRGNASWDNYKDFLSIIKQVKSFLRNKDKNVTLLDAHSFLWILGDQMQQSYVTKRQDPPALSDKEIKHNEPSLEQVYEKVEQATPIIEEDDELAFPEGKEIFRLHRLKERSRELINTAKRLRLLQDKSLCCDVCHFSFSDKYGELGEGFIEAHHVFPISQLTSETTTKIEDLAMVCSNCHRMLHRRRPWLTLDELKKLIN